MDYYHTNIEEITYDDYIGKFESRFREAVYYADNKKDVPGIIKSHIKESRNINPDLYKIMMKHFKGKSKPNKEKEDEKTKKLLTNLAKAENDIDYHEIEFSLSDKQKKTKAAVNKVIKHCRETLKEPEKSSSKGIEGDHQTNKGMGR